MADLLAAQGVLLAALTALVAAWDAELQRTRNIAAEGRYQDNQVKHADVRRVLFFRALPLTVYATLSWLILLPVVVQIVHEVLNFWSTGGNLQFDAMKASLALVFLGLMILTAYLWTTTLRIVDKERTIANLPRS